MPFKAAPYDTDTIGLMTAALEAAWVAAQLGVAGVSHDDRAKMEAAILDAVARGGRDFKRLQQAAFDALGATTLEPAERRLHAKVVPLERRRR
jgi:hypothetical protein